MQIAELKKYLAPHASTICQELYPDGRIESGHFKIGSLEGEAGRSLSVILTGDRAGMWTDFATSDHGDLIDLIMTSKGMSVIESKAWVEKRFGIKSKKRKISPAGKTKIRTPKMPKPMNTGLLHSYLQGRGFKEVGDLVYRHKLYASDALTTDGIDLIFQFFDTEGKLVDAKHKPMDYDGSSKFVTADCKKILYGWHTVKPEDRQVWITEGELDAIAARELGYSALSMPNGVNGFTWINNDYDNLDRFDEIIIATDQDEVGERAAEELHKRLGDRCLRIRIPTKDINDLLKEKGYETARQILEQAYDEAKWQDPTELFSALEFSEKVNAVFESEDEAVVGIGYGFRKIDNTDLRVRPHELHGVTGYNGSGKSMFLGQVVLNLIKQEKKVCIASMEMEPEITLKRMVMQASAKSRPDQSYRNRIYDWWSQNLWLFHAGLTPSADTLFNTFEYAYRRYGVTIFVIDSLTNLSSQQDYEKQQKVVETCVNLKRAFPVTVFLVTHVKKGDDEYALPNKFDVKGSGAITDLADTFVSIWKNKRKAEHIFECEQEGRQPDKDIADSFDVVFSVLKNRHGMWEGKSGFMFDPSSCQYLEDDHSHARPYVKPPPAKDHPLI